MCGNVNIQAFWKRYRYRYRKRFSEPYSKLRRERIDTWIGLAVCCTGTVGNKRNKKEKIMRASGILLPVSALPSKYGIGSFSKEAYTFVNQLKRGGQKYWQILPLGPTGYGDSPYQSFSTYAGNPYYIDLETLTEEGLLTKEECEACDFGDNASYVDYEKIYYGRFDILRKAFHRFVPDTDFEEFVKENAFWLEDYSLYMAVKLSLIHI